MIRMLLYLILPTLLKTSTELYNHLFLNTKYHTVWEDHSPESCHLMDRASGKLNAYVRRRCMCCSSSSSNSFKDAATLRTSFWEVYTFIELIKTEIIIEIRKLSMFITKSFEIRKKTLFWLVSTSRFLFVYTCRWFGYM